MKQTFHGELIEVGSFEQGCGMIIRVIGEELLFRMDPVHTAAAAKHLFQQVTITVEMGPAES